MPSVEIELDPSPVRTARTARIEEMFDLAPEGRRPGTRIVDLPIEERAWRVGLIAGPAGSGKSTLARAAFGDRLLGEFDWPADRAFVDAFPEALSVEEIASLCCSVGFCSPPSWLRPYASLSTGERLRASLARAFATPADLVAFDAFGDAVEASSARFASAAAASFARRAGRRLVAVSQRCDLARWLQPDWIYRTDRDAFAWRRVQPRPAVRLRIRRGSRDEWRIFRRHHYLRGEVHRSAACFVGEVEGRPACFCAVLFFPHPRRPGWREHRLVCLPEYQGVGLGAAAADFVASLFAATGRPYRSVTSSPTMIQRRARSEHWKTTRAPGRAHRQTAPRLKSTSSRPRITASFEYVGPQRRDPAIRLGVLRPGRGGSGARGGVPPPAQAGPGEARDPHRVAQGRELQVGGGAAGRDRPLDAAAVAVDGAPVRRGAAARVLRAGGRSPNLCGDPRRASDSRPLSIRLARRPGVPRTQVPEAMEQSPGAGGRDGAEPAGRAEGREGRV